MLVNVDSTLEFLLRLDMSYYEESPEWGGGGDPVWADKKPQPQFSAQLRKRDLRHVIWQKLDNFDNRIIEPDLSARGSQSSIIQLLHQLLFQPVVVKNVFKLALFEPGKCLENTQCAQYPLRNVTTKFQKWGQSCDGERERLGPSLPQRVSTPL